MISFCAVQFQFGIDESQLIQTGVKCFVVEFGEVRGIVKAGTHRPNRWTSESIWRDSALARD